MDRFMKFHFKGQKENEKILLVLHRHWFDIASQFLMILLMLAVFVGSYTFSSIFYNLTDNPAFAKELVAFLRNLFFMLIWITFFVIWIDYYLDVWIVTDRRIVNIEQKGLFARVTSELEMDKIQDVTTEVQGLIHTFLNYGDLFVQTAAEKERFIFHNIPDPYSVKDLLMAIQKKQEALEENQFGELIRKKIHG